MMRENEIEHVEWTSDLTVAQLIINMAQWQVKCIPEFKNGADFTITTDTIRNAADLVFFAMDLIEERKRG